MTLTEDFGVLFDNRDINGNEPGETDTDSDSDLETNDIRAIAAHIEKEFGTLTRGKKCTVPKKEIDVTKLQQVYKESGCHRFKVGRRAKKNMLAVDTATQGAMKVSHLDILKRWKDEGFTRSLDPHLRGWMGWLMIQVLSLMMGRGRAEWRFRYGLACC